MIDWKALKIMCLAIVHVVNNILMEQCQNISGVLLYVLYQSYLDYLRVCRNEKKVEGRSLAADELVVCAILCVKALKMYYSYSIFL